MKNALTPKGVEALNRLLLSARFSLAIYVREGHLWTHRGDEPLVEAIEQIANDHDRFTERLTTFIGRHVGPVAHGHFSTDFTRFDEVALDYVLPELIGERQRMIEQIEQSLPDLESDVVAKRLAQEFLGCEKGHLDTLTEIEQTMGRGKWMAT